MQALKSIKNLWSKIIFILTRTQKKWGIVVAIMTLIGAICETVGVSIILPLVQVMLQPAQIRENAIAQYFIKNFNLNTDMKLIWAIGLAVISVYIFKNVLLLLLSYVRVKYSCKVQRELSTEMLDSYMKRGYLFFLNMSTGELLRGVQNNIANVYNVIYNLFRLLAEILTTASIFVFIMITDLTTSISISIVVVLCMLIVIFVIRKWTKKFGEINYKYTAIVSKTLLQIFGGIKEVLVMNRQNYFKKDYQSKYLKQQEAIIGQTVSAESPTYFIESVCVATLIFVVCVKAVTTGGMTEKLIPQFAAFAVAAFRILPSLGRIASYFNVIIFSLPGVHDTYKNLQEARQIIEPLKTKQTENVIDCLKEKITVENIEWRYPTNKKLILKDLSLEIKKGQSVAFVGTSGAGKTTLADILLGLLEPNNGAVKIDGIDIYKCVAGRNKMIGFVPQNIYLADDTIKRNVAYGITDEDIEDEKVWQALRKAQLIDVINELPMKLNTEIGERGMRLSGGQRQRIAIARALYSDPDILILDEATSALDSDTEQAVIESIENLRGEKTLIVIAHRLTTIKNCDMIYQIESGKAIKRNYSELMK